MMTLGGLLNKQGKSRSEGKPAPRKRRGDQDALKIIAPPQFDALRGLR